MLAAVVRGAELSAAIKAGDQLLGNMNTEFNKKRSTLQVDRLSEDSIEIKELRTAVEVMETFAHRILALKQFRTFAITQRVHGEIDQYRLSRLLEIATK